MKKNSIASAFFRDKNTGVLSAIDMKYRRNRILYYSMVAIMIVYCAIVVLPCVWMILTGFKSVTEMYSRPARFFPKEFDLSKIGVVWSQLKMYRYYLNTFIMAGGAVIADLVVSGLAGYVISRLKPRGAKFVYVLVFSLMLLPSTMSTVPLYMTFRDFPLLHINLLDTYIPIWLMCAASMFNIILFKTFFDGISNSIIEAARIDGATDLQIFFKIMIPLSVPVMITVAVFTFNNQFGNFFWPNLIISSKEKYVIGMQLYNLKSSALTMDYQMIAILFSIIPQLLIFSIFQKHIMGGVNVGGVKG